MVHIVALGFGRKGKINEEALAELAGKNVILVKKKPAKNLANRKLIKKVLKATCGEFQ